MKFRQDHSVEVAALKSCFCFQELNRLEKRDVPTAGRISPGQGARRSALREFWFMGKPALGNGCPRPPLGRDRRSCAAGNVQGPREMPKITDARIAILATNGFEQSELKMPLDKLKQAGATVHVVTPDGKIIKG